MVVDSANVKDTTCNFKNNNDDLFVGKLRVREQSPVDTLKTDTTEVIIQGEIEPGKTHGVIFKDKNN